MRVQKRYIFGAVAALLAGGVTISNLAHNAQEKAEQAGFNAVQAKLDHATMKDHNFKLVNPDDKLNVDVRQAVIETRTPQALADLEANNMGAINEGILRESSFVKQAFASNLDDVYAQAYQDQRNKFLLGGFLSKKPQEYVDRQDTYSFQDGVYRVIDNAVDAVAGKEIAKAEKEVAARQAREEAAATVDITCQATRAKIDQLQDKRGPISLSCKL